MRQETDDDDKQAVSFNVNAFVTGVLLAAVVSAMGFRNEIR